MILVRKFYKDLRGRDFSNTEDFYDSATDAINDLSSGPDFKEDHIFGYCFKSHAKIYNIFFEEPELKYLATYFYRIDREEFKNWCSTMEALNKKVEG